MFGKRGKYEAVPTQAAVKYKKKSAKANLLSAYFTSLLCLILCATMFMSTSMAWFTSEVNNAGNEIYVGMLDVQLLHEDGGAWVDLEKNPDHKVLSGDTRWEPNCTHIEYLKVQNSGDLAFNYRLGMSIAYPADFDGAKIAQAQEAARYITVYVTQVEDTYVRPDGIGAIESGWTKLGTLADVLAGKAIFGGTMKESDVVNVTEGVISRKETAHEYAIAFHMDLNAPSSIMGAQLKDINIKLVAAQHTAEEDVFSEMYDQLSLVYDEADLRAAVAQGGNVFLMNDVSMNADESLVVDGSKTVNLYMNGFEIAGIAHDDSVNRQVFLVKAGSTLNVIGEGTISIDHDGIWVWKDGNMTSVIYTYGDVNVENVTLINAGHSEMSYAMASYIGGNMNVKNSTLVARYCPLRVVNFQNGTTNVDVTKSELISTDWLRAFWVHNATNYGTVNVSGLLTAEEAAEAGNTVYGSVRHDTESANSLWVGGTEGGVYQQAANGPQLATAMTTAEKVYLTADINLGETMITIPAGNKVTLDLAGHDLSGSYSGTSHYAMFDIPKGAELIIEGEGNVVAQTVFDESNRSGAIFQNAGKLTINGGNYTLHDTTEGQTWIIATIIDNRTKSTSDEALVTINGGEFSVSGNAKNLFRNYPQQGGSATMIFNDGMFHARISGTTYIWNQEASTYLGELYFNGGVFENGIVYEDYNGHDDIHIADGVVIAPYEGNG